MPDDDYPARLKAALAELDAKGVRHSASRPPYFKVARHYNLKVRPPYYASIGFNALFGCIVFSLLWGVITWILVWSKTEFTGQDLLAQSLNGGVIAGSVIALFCYLAFRFHKLTPWDQLLSSQTQDPE